jgi:hypothetical protein
MSKGKHVVKAYSGSRLHINTLLNSAVDGGELSAAPAGHFRQWPLHPSKTAQYVLSRRLGYYKSMTGDRQLLKIYSKIAPL